MQKIKIIQSQYFDSSKKPLTKIDGDLEDMHESKEIYERRGFEDEIVG